MYANKKFAPRERIIDYHGVVTTSEDADEASDYCLAFGLRNELAVDARRAAGGAPSVPNASASRACSPELALVRLATEACESVAVVLETRLVSLPEEDRAAFAAALKRSSERVFKCR